MEVSVVIMCEIRPLKSVVKSLVSRSLVLGQKLPLATSNLFWYKTGKAFTSSAHPCVRAAVQAFGPDHSASCALQTQARLDAVNLLILMWLQDKINRIIGHTTYEHFIDILRTSNELSIPCVPREPTPREKELLEVMDTRTHALVRQALALEWNECLVDVSFLKPETVFEAADSTGYDETLLAELQLQMFMLSI